METSALLAQIYARRLPGLDAGPDAVYPCYDGLSLLNLPASVCHWLAAPHFGAAPPLIPELLNALPGSYRRVVLLLVDGLGWQWLERYCQGEDDVSGAQPWRGGLAERVQFPLTSISPSTTSAALTSLWTARPPAGHGILAYEVWLKEFSAIANMLTYSVASFSGDVGGLRRAGFDPQTFLGAPVLGAHLLANGVQPFAFQHLSICNSLLSQMLLPGVNVLPFRTYSDLWVSLQHWLSSRDERAYAYVYLGELDDLMHRFGPEDERVYLEFALFSLMLEKFLCQARRNGRGDTLVLLSADHGHLATPPASMCDLRQHPEVLADLTMLPSGESRLPFLFVRPGREQHLQACLERFWPGRLRLLSAAQVMDGGLMGAAPFHPAFSERLGDFVLVPQGDAHCWWANRESTLRGRHGGLSAVEMIVPLCGWVI